MTTANSHRVVLVDWDNTLRAGFTVVPWTQFLESSGLFGGASRLREMLESFNPASDDYDAFCERMALAYAAGLVGRSQADVLEAAKAFVKADNSIFNFARHLLAYLEGEGFSVIVISGAPDELMHEYAEAVGFSLAGTLQLETASGSYTGEVLHNSGLSERKAQAVRAIAEHRSVAMAFGDSTADFPLFDAASVGFLVRRGRESSVQFPARLVRIDPESPADEVIGLVKKAIAENLSI